ncbi:DUF2249 domain-containing protein, partial [Pseudomonas syringae pv. actinidiae]|nr:DUF2249 domain-containing protein [Pseudomonas syringae pv. actinidiae]
MTHSDYELDVRPILAEGGEPFGAIMEAVAKLAPGQGLRLLAPFKPAPLFHVLGQRGFEPTAREIGGGDWEVTFRPTAEKQDPAGVEKDFATGPGGNAEAWPEPIAELDNRGLEPPEPMVRTLTNAFSTGRIAQAWMLTGVRGVGKTTTVRILARALNYKTAEIDRPSVDLSVPGEHCHAIMEGRHVDVI